MKMIPNGRYSVNMTTKELIYQKTQIDYGKYVSNWSPFVRCGFDDIFDAGFIAMIKSEEDSILIARYPTISYSNILKFKISDVFDTSLFNEEDN